MTSRCSSVVVGWVTPAFRAAFALMLLGVVLLLGLLSSRATSAAQDSSDADERVTSAIPRDRVIVRVDMRSQRVGQAKRAQRTVWDGSVDVTGGRLVGVRAWKDDPRDVVEGNSWKITTQHQTPWNIVQRKRGHELMPLEDASLMVELADTTERTELIFDTAQGGFQFSLDQIAPGATATFLKGNARVSRVPATALILSAPTEDDFPAVAVRPDGGVVVAYSAFSHGEGFRVRVPVEEPPKKFADLGKPTGGDQVMLLRETSDGWAEPLAITSAGEDVFRTAVAIDRDGRIWVFWVAKQEERWGLFGRSVQGEELSEVVCLSGTGAGPSLLPVATTDSEGRVWVAWQMYDQGRFRVVTAKQEGDGFSSAVGVADSEGNQWAPSLAASGDGRVAVAWDTYESGSYDVMARIVSRGEESPVLTVARSARAEMRPSATFDARGRLWIAYENGPENWGKDYGALEKSGAPLYRGRTIAVRVLSKTGELLEPVDDPVYAFYPWQRTNKQAKQGNLALPRLGTDAAGRVWLAVRSGRLGTRVGVGTVWFEHVSWYEGNRWADETVCPRTDAILDNRPCWVALPSGEMLLIGSTDQRYRMAGRLPQWLAREIRASGETMRAMSKPSSRWPDPVNSELMAARLSAVEGVAEEPELRPVEAVVAPKVLPSATKEWADIQRARAMEASIGGKTLRLLRGEFHRHTELSGDGGGDGTLMDMWRYGIDAADMDWIGNGDHDNGAGREYSWWITQKTTDLFQLPATFTPMFTYERSCTYPDGHRNVVFDYRGVRTLPRLRGGMGQPMDDLPVDAKRPNTPDTQMLYRYLAEFDGICASHTSGTDMGTDWRDGNGKIEPIVEIYQGCRQSYEMPGAPRTGTPDYSLGGWRPFGFVSLALKRGYRLGFQASSDHVSTHISYCNVWAEDFSREAILDAMKARHVYGATDNIVAVVRSGDHFMGDEFTTTKKPILSVHLIGTQPFARVHIIRDNLHVHGISPSTAEVEFEWTDFDPPRDRPVYYYVRGEQTDGELVWVSPMWITYRPGGGGG